jgi:catechol 2,3-dioxygenase-like lactoylglutathione lyase family enzyme
MSSGPGFVIADMNLPVRRVNVINLFAEDLAGTRSFYQGVLGLPLAFEDGTVAVFELENMMVCLTDVSAAPALIAPTAVASPTAGSRFVLAVRVDDVDAACTELAQHGVVLLNGPVDRPWGMRTASFADPAGHIWEIAQDLDQDGATAAPAE